MPVLVGEFSVLRWAPGAAQWVSDAVDLFEKYGWSWCFHSYRSWNGWNPTFDATDPSNNNSDGGKTTDRLLVLMNAWERNITYDTLNTSGKGAMPGGQGSLLADVRLFSNPGSFSSGVRFLGLPENACVRIYSPDGRLAAQSETVNSVYTWHIGKNGARRTAAGIYFCRISLPHEERVIRFVMMP